MRQIQTERGPEKTDEREKFQRSRRKHSKPGRMPVDDRLCDGARRVPRMDGSREREEREPPVSRREAAYPRILGAIRTPVAAGGARANSPRSRGCTRQHGAE